MGETLTPGLLDIPDGCQSEIRVSVKVPPNTKKIPTKGKVQPTPAVNLVYSRHQTKQSALESLSHVLDAARAREPHYTIISQEEVTFKDGKSGVSAVLSLQVDETVKLQQKHVLRTDEGVLTHFVLTGPAMGFDRTDREWSPRILAYKLH